MDEKEVFFKIKKRILDLQFRGELTSHGERVSFASIARTLDPPVSRAAVSLVATGVFCSPRIRKAIERELGERYW